MLINALIESKKKKKKKRKISKKKKLHPLQLGMKYYKLERTGRGYRVDHLYSFRSNFTHRRSRKSWHWLWDGLQTESHAFRVVALIFAGRCQNLFGLHRGQVRRSGPRLKRNSHVIVAYRKASNLTQTCGICELSRFPGPQKFEITNRTDEEEEFFFNYRNTFF